MLALALAPFALAGEIQVVPRVPIEIIVDGLPVPMDANGQTMTVAGLAAGTHTVEARNAFGKTQAWKEVQLAEDEQLRFEYRQKELWHVATTRLAPPPPPVELGVPAVVGLSVDVHDGSGASVAVGADAWGGGVVVDDGMGGRVVVQGGVHVGPVVPVHPGVPVGPVTAIDPLTGRPYVVAPPPPRSRAMEPAAFEGLVRAIDDASFSSEKQAVLAAAAGHHLFTCAQMVRILQAFDFEADRLDALRAARHTVVDPQNAYLLGPAFDFSSSREEALGLFR